jgi:hypothetical protein
VAEVGLISKNFFGADGSIRSFMDQDGEFRYVRGASGAQFEFRIILSSDRSLTIRVNTFNHRGADLERDAYEQVQRILKALEKLARN